MDGKIVKALYTDIASKDPIRPLMMGVHFEERRCYATDTHVLVIYNESDARFAGKTLNATGTEIQGNYPSVDRVVPKEVCNLFKGDKAQLYRALCWWTRQKDSHSEDRVVIGEQTFTITLLKRMLYVLSLTAEFGTSKFWLNEQARPAKIVSDNLTAVIMPCQPTTQEEIDDVRSFESPVTVSYANLINTYALESSKPKEVAPAAFDWLK